MLSGGPAAGRQPFDQGGVRSLGDPVSGDDASVVEVRELRKTYRVLNRRTWWRDLVRPEYRFVQALRGVSFTLRPGESVAYLGPNGAGKSSTIKCLAGIIKPDSGTVRVFQQDPWQRRTEVLARIGAVFGQKSLLFPDLTLRDALDIYRRVYGLRRRDVDEFVEEFDTHVRVRHLLSKPVRRLSLGERMRGELMAALVHDPDLLLLDEPTIGLDLTTREGFLQLLRRRVDRGRTVLLATHRLEDVEAVCRRALLLSSGRLIYDGSVDDLRRKVGGKRSARVRYRGRLPGAVAGSLPVIRRHQPSDEEGEVEVEVPPDARPSSVVAELEAVVEVVEVTVGYPRLEHVLQTVFARTEKGDAG